MATDLVSLVNSVGNTGKAHATIGGGGDAVAKGGAKTEADDSVRMMQKLMMDLGSQLSQTDVAQGIVDRINSENPEALKSIQNPTKYIVGMGKKFSATAAAGLGKSPVDGVWGKNTKGALSIINSFAQTIGINDVIISEGNGDAPYKEMKAEDLQAVAQQNIDNLSRLFGHIGLRTTVAEAGGTNRLIVDSIDTTLPEDGVNNPFAHWGNHPVMVSDLINLTAFFEFTRVLSPTGGGAFHCKQLNEMSDDKTEPTATELENPWDKGAPKTTPATASSLDDYMQKLAREVLDRSIYRLGQDTTQPIAATVPATRPAGDDPHCVSTLEAIIEWFKDRSKQMFDPIYEAYRGKSLPSPRPDRKGKVGTLLDAQLADYYVRQMGKISDEWKDAKDAIIDLLKKAKGNSPIVTSRVLREALGGAGAGAGVGAESTRGKAHGAEGEYEDSEGRTVHRRPNAPPLAEFMSLQNFTRYNSPSLEKVRELTDGGVLPELEFDKWSSSWATLAQEVAGKDDAEKYKKFGPWAEAIKNTLNEVYRAWKARRHNTEELRDQYDLLNEWIGRINSTLGVYNSTFREAIHRAETLRAGGGR
ncbi:hypothetical protein M0R72_02205 [Candidatus Pacearchaeota archaeon]|jgi:hypothetical protein|nr:hypothetical protein [Candidatus Pacearchaeota archaeon]